MTADSTPGRSVFDELMAEATAGVAGFGHREHVHLTWLAVRRLGIAAATDLVSNGIRETARYAGAPQKYHVTMSRALAIISSRADSSSGVGLRNSSTLCTN